MNEIQKEVIRKEEVERRIVQLEENTQTEYQKMEACAKIEEQPGEEEEEDEQIQRKKHNKDSYNIMKPDRGRFFESLSESEENSDEHQYINTYLTNTMHTEVKSEMEYTPLTKRKDMEDQQTFQIRNLDTGDVYDSRIEETDNKLNYSYSSLLMTSFQYPGTHIKYNDENWKCFWNKVKKNNMLLLDYSESGDLLGLTKLLDNESIPTQVNFQSLDNWTALHFASSNGHAHIVEYLLQHSANPFAVSLMLRTPLHSAVIGGSLQCVKELVKSGGKKLIDAQDNEFNTVLHLAVENNQQAIVEYLLDNKADFNLTNHKKQLAYQLCTSFEIRNIFSEHGAATSSKSDGYDRLCVGGRIKSNSRVDQVTKLLFMTQKIQKDLIVRQEQILQKKEKLLKEMSWTDFRFIKKLGQGSFGEVFLVEKDKKLFAIKVQDKQKVVQKNLQRYVQTEKNALSMFSHPFIIKLHYAFQNEHYLFMVMEFAEGGDMGNNLNKRNKLPEDEAKFYTAQIILALEELHRQDVIFRDLKPDNVVLDRFGNAKLTDFGLSKEGIKETTHTKSFCGSVAYLAPEILMKRPHSRTVDWYLLGTFLYELLVGIPPYYDNKQDVLFDNIKKGPLKIPRSMSAEAKDLIKQLLNRNPKERLGSKNDAYDVKVHSFFKDFNWDDLSRGNMKAPPLDIPKIDINQSIAVNFDTRRISSIVQRLPQKNQKSNTPNPQIPIHIDNWNYIN